jgi:branched-chain amino acid transport system ATP-binding protein
LDTRNRKIKPKNNNRKISKPQNQKILELTNVHSGYGEIEVLKGVNFDVHEGDLLCVIGNNGAGKSTLLKTIFGLLKPTQGSIKFMNEEISGEKINKLLSQGISMTPQGRCNFPEMTIEENLEMGAYIRDDKEISQDIELIMGQFPVLRKKKKEYAGNLSGGEQQILEMACALLLHPRLLLIDEPSLGLAPMMVDQVFSSIMDINQKGTTVIMVEQNAKQALEIANRAIVLDLGYVRMDDSAVAIRDNPDIKKLFLGE